MEPNHSFQDTQVSATCLCWATSIQSKSPHSTSFLRSCQRISPGSWLWLWIFRNKVTFSQWGDVSPSPKTQAGGPPLSAVRNCLFNILKATLHIRGRSSISNLRKRHGVVIGTHLTHGCGDAICVNVMLVTLTYSWFAQLTANSILNNSVAEIGSVR
jgi:hypothetical protein